MFKEMFTLLDLGFFTAELLIYFALETVLIAYWYLTIYNVSQRFSNKTTEHPSIQ